MKSANDQLAHHMGSESVTREPISRCVYTEGVKELIEIGKCYWLVSDILIYQLEHRFKQEEFQHWRLERKDEVNFMLTCDDGNERIILEREYMSDFPFEEVDLYFQTDTLFLPSEY